MHHNPLVVVRSKDFLSFALIGCCRNFCRTYKIIRSIEGKNQFELSLNNRFYKIISFRESYATRYNYTEVWDLYIFDKQTFFI